MGEVGWVDQSTRGLPESLVIRDRDSGVLIEASDVPHAVPAIELDRLITAIDQHYTVEDLGYAGDARVINVRDKVTGGYILTASLTQTP